MISRWQDNKYSLIIFIICSAMSLMLFGAKPSHAIDAVGNVHCDANQDGLMTVDDARVEGIVVTVESTTASYSNSDTTDANGFFSVPLLSSPETYVQTLDGTSLPADAIILVPAGGQYVLDVTDTTNDAGPNFWLYSSLSCVHDVCGNGVLEDGEECDDGNNMDGDGCSAHCTAEENCWLTAGGVKFSTVTGTMVDEFKPKGGPMHSWGGNVNPACAPNKGHWNHVAQKDSLHFQATDIEVITCGNVPGIEPGSESPVTPVNFIEFTGPATLKGIKGNKDDYGDVCYFAYAEDRNEPGSNGAKDGVDVDRYYLHVFDCDTGDTLLLVDVDGDPATIDPVTITGGNMQMHWQPCDN